MSLWDMLATLAISNLLTFGNGTLMIALLQRSFVQEHAIVSSEQLLYAFAIARVTPGQANLYVAAIGYMAFGLPGAVLSMVAIAAPAYLMLPLQRGYRQFRDNGVVYGFTRGIAAAAAGMIVAIAWQLGRESITDVLGVIVFGIAIALMVFTKLPMLASLAVATAVGVILVLWGPAIRP